jgi:hypothetical protein
MQGEDIKLCEKSTQIVSAQVKIDCSARRSSTRNPVFVTKELGFGGAEKLEGNVRKIDGTENERPTGASKYHNSLKSQLNALTNLRSY